MTNPAFSFHKCFENGVTGVPIGTIFIPDLMKTVILVQKFTWGERERYITQTSIHAREHRAPSDLLAG
jgi:hypothetical protein